MKKFRKTMIAIMSAALFMTACANKDNSQPLEEKKAEEKAAAEETGDKEEPSKEITKEGLSGEELPEEESLKGQESESGKEQEAEREEDQNNKAYEDPASLPRYVYGGSEKYLDVISDHMIKSWEELFGDAGADVSIPFSIIAYVDDKDPQDILAYGTYNINGFDLYNTTLCSANGAWNAGIYHLKTNDDGSFTVTKAELPQTDEESKQLFKGVPDLYDKISELMDKECNNKLEEAIAEYVSLNNLYITQWQDNSKEPVAVKGAKETPKEAQFYQYDSSLGYRITYDLRELFLNASDVDDMYSKVENDDKWTGTLMVVARTEGSDTEAAVKEILSDAGAKDIKVEEAVLAGMPCSRAEYDNKLEDGRIFRYICYGLKVNDGCLVFKLETTVEKGVSEMSTEELDKLYEPTLSSLVIE